MTGTPENNVNRIDNILLETRTASGGDNISLNELAKTMFLDSLPSRFAAIRTMIETASKDYSINEIQNLLVAEESRQGSILADPLFAGSTTTPRNSCKHGRSPAQCWTCDPTKHPSKAICSTCGEKGHKTSNSPKCTKTIIGASLKKANAICDDDGSWEEALPKPKFAKIAHVGAIQKRKEFESFLRDEEASEEFAYNSSRNREQRSDDRYILDSGCAQTILKNKALIKNYMPLKHPILMKGASGAELSCTG